MCDAILGVLERFNLSPGGLAHVMVDPIDVAAALCEKLRSLPQYASIIFRQFIAADPDGTRYNEEQVVAVFLNQVVAEEAFEVMYENVGPVLPEGEGWSMRSYEVGMIYPLFPRAVALQAVLPVGSGNPSSATVTPVSDETAALSSDSESPCVLRVDTERYPIGLQFLTVPADEFDKLHAEAFSDPDVWEGSGDTIAGLRAEVEALKAALAAIDEGDFIRVWAGPTGGLYNASRQQVFFVDDDEGEMLLLAAKSNALDLIEAARALLGGQQ